MFKKKDNAEELDRQPGLSSTGRASPYSYRSSRSARQGGTSRYTREEQEKRSVEDRTRHIKNLPAYIAIIIVVVSLIYSIILEPNAKVEITSNTSNSFLQPTSVYQQATDKILRSSYLNRSKLTINADSIASQISNKFPELSGVTVIVPLSGRQPILEIRPARSVIVLSNSQGKFMINQNGAAMIKLDTPEQLQHYSLPEVTDDSGLRVKLGQQVLPVDSIAFINTVIDQFSAKNIPIESMTLAAVPYELDVQVRGEPYIIKFNLLEDPNYAVGTYLATVKELAALKQSPTQYIDVRIAGRAYYK